MMICSFYPERKRLTQPSPPLVHWLVAHCPVAYCALANGRAGLDPGQRAVQAGLRPQVAAPHDWPAGPMPAIVPPEILTSWPPVRAPSAVSTTVTSRSTNSPVELGTRT
jgi:hypothetical protein